MVLELWEEIQVGGAFIRCGNRVCPNGWCNARHNRCTIGRSLPSRLKPCYWLAFGRNSVDHRNTRRMIAPWRRNLIWILLVRWATVFFHVFDRWFDAQLQLGSDKGAETNRNVSNEPSQIVFASNLGEFPKRFHIKRDFDKFLWISDSSADQL